ncbi:hypothetical protein CH289_16085 [Rhodococcus sp. RS1C4]|nr:hypothetical protein CH289_16085 [Rhodococcus sp. RS1C4]
MALIRVDELDEGPSVRQIRMFILDPDLSQADPFSLDVGKFYERHPQPRGLYTLGAGLKHFDLYEEIEAMQLVEQWTRGATLVGANTAFDAALLESRIRYHGGCPSWHHRLVDVENLVAGRLQLLEDNRLGSLQSCANVMEISYSDLDLHTAMGDAELARRVFDEVFS